MKKALILFAFFVSASLTAQSYYAHIKNADSLYKVKKYEESLIEYQEAFKIKNSNKIDLYNAACTASLAQKNAIAFQFLEQSIKQGFKNLDHIKADTDLNFLHNNKRWNKIIKELEIEVAEIEKNYNKPLQKELLIIFEDDQSARIELSEKAKMVGWNHPDLDSIKSVVRHNDSINLSKIINILDNYGWVGSNLVGDKASSAIFLVIQHSDLKTQQKYLPLMREAVFKGNTESASLALLEDRVALREGRKQIYGSQIGSIPNTKRYYVQPLEDPENVNSRREKMGLGPIEEYVSRWGIEWDSKEYLKQLPEYEKLYWQK